jgi:hypothetical protein
MNMKRKVRLNESEFRNLIKRLVEQSEGDYYKIGANEYMELMKLSGYHGKGITRLPRFEGKPLWIEGDVNLSNTPTDSLGNVANINGSLNINSTNISDLGDTQVRGYVSKTNTPLQRKIDAEILRKKRAEADVRRANEEWSIENADDVGLKANALFKYLVEEGAIDDEEADVYDAVPQPYAHYGLQTFEVLGQDGGYAVGDEEEMDAAALRYAEDYIQDIGLDGFREGYIDEYVDKDEVADYFQDFYEDDVWNNPEIYFAEGDYELTSDQERRISEIESEIEDYERQQRELDTEAEDYDELYVDFQNLIDDLESEKDEIIPDEVTQDMVDNKVDELLYQVKRDPVQYIREYGMELKNFVDEKELAKGLVADDGWGIMNSYDGSYDSVRGEDGVLYYVMRVE